MVGGGGAGGCVKLTAALNPSSWRGLDPIRPAQPRTAWQGLSCRRHQRADEDGGQSVRPPLQLHKLGSFRQKAGRQQFAAVVKNAPPRKRGFAHLLRACIKNGAGAPTAHLHEKEARASRAGVTTGPVSCP